MSVSHNLHSQSYHFFLYTPKRHLPGHESKDSLVHLHKKVGSKSRHNQPLHYLADNFHWHQYWIPYDIFRHQNPIGLKIKDVVFNKCATLKKKEGQNKD